MSDIATRIASLPPEKRALLAARLARVERPVHGLRQVPARESAVSAPLSVNQRSVWFLGQLFPGNVAYNTPIALRFSGRIDPDALEWSWNELLRRHDLLRTVFEARDGDPVQFANPFRPVRLRRMDLGHLPESERMEAAREEAVREAQQPFDLAIGPPWRAKLLCCSEGEHVLVVIVHHIICDGWSVGILVGELIAGYEAFLRGGSTPLPELPIQYADYAIWQREQLAGPGFQRHVELWRQRLEGITGAILVPLDKPRPAETTFRGARIFTQLSPQLVESLRRMAHTEGATLFMALLTAFKVLLSRYSGQSDIIVGSPIANRERREFEALIGFFANTMALRTDLSGDPAFVELLARVREVTLLAYDSQEVPFEKLVEELKPERQLNRNPFFDISFSLQNLPTPAVNVPDLGIDLLRLDNKTSKFDLSVAMVETSRGLLTTVEYSTDLFDSSTAVRLLSNYRTLLEGIIADPRQTISRLPLLTENERNQILVEWNATGVEYPRDRCIHELFASQARRDPQAIAAVFGEQKISYGELERRSGELAGHLRALEVSSEARVAICMEPSVEMIVGLLAILKAGAAYVPIDPEYPEERIAFILAESEAEVVLTHKGFAAQFAGKGIKSVWLDGGWEDIERIEDVEPPLWPAGKPDDVAYVMFTSGSTGKPKGVRVPHRAVNRLVVNCDYLRLGPEDVVAQVSNCCFDAATFEIWGALLNGSRLAGIERERVLSAESFSAELARHQVTTVVVTTALFNELAHERADIFCTVHNVLFGGEQCDAGAVAKVIESRGPPQRLLNVYGPTETTTFATWYEIKAGQNFERRIPIGRPIANTEVYILDGHCNPVPVGVAGEIYIGGDGVAKGYLNRVDLTTERFIASPFVSGQRLYRTGDQGRFLPDGNIEFLGRLDHQVKVRGFRIELGEVEAALTVHPAVRQAVVCVRDDEGAVKTRQLVAYVVPVQGSGSAGLNERLRAFLKEKLPDYMVPSAVVVLKEFPLTSNGKIDRKALPEPVLDRERGGYVAPCGETEKAVAEAWSAVLCVENIGAQESFFGLGGHSLMVTRVISRLRSIFGIDIPLRVFFENPTVAAIAAYVEGARCTAGPFPAGTLDREEFVL